MASNFEAGLVIKRSFTEGYSIDGAVFVGSSQLLGGYTRHGMIGPQDENWQVGDARFYRFMDGAGGIGQCWKCSRY